MISHTIQQAFEIAVGHHQAGRLAEAERFYRQILSQEAGHPAALHMLGVLAHQAGHSGAGVDLVRQAVAGDPNCAEAWDNLGLILTHMGRFVEAVEACRRAVGLRGNEAKFHFDLGMALQGAGQNDGAVEAYQRAIGLRADFAEAHGNLAVVFSAMRRMRDSIAASRRAVELRPNYVQAWVNLGAALTAQGDLDEAIGACRRALEIDGRIAEAASCLGAALKLKGELQEAESWCRHAVELRPGFVEGWFILGGVYELRGAAESAIDAYETALKLDGGRIDVRSKLALMLARNGRFAEAEAACRKAIEMDPRPGVSWSNLGSVLLWHDKLEEAVQACRKAVALEPGIALVQYNLGTVLKEIGQTPEAIAAYRRALEIEPTNESAWGNLLLTMHYEPKKEALEIVHEHARWNAVMAEPLRKEWRTHGNDRSENRRLRVGYVSADFRNHVVGRFMLPLLRAHDRDEVEIFGYSQAQVEDEMTEKLHACCGGWRKIVGMTDAKVAELVRDDRVDVLVDLSMHTVGNRLLAFARKPAPVQVTYLAYCSTTGLEAMDYRLSDGYLDPVGADDSIYSETTVRLEGSYWCYAPVEGMPEVGAAPAARAGCITFGCLNRACKVNRAVVDAWAEIMRRVAGSRMVLLAYEGSQRNGILSWFDAGGVKADRIEFVKTVELMDYFSMYHRIDVGLDTFPFAGGTTTCDALWMGVPVVSLAGRTAVGRGGVSILSHVGLPEWVAATADDYVQRAVDLAANRSRLAELRASLRERMHGSSLMNAPRFARDVEAAYRAMWRNWCRGE